MLAIIFEKILILVFTYIIVFTVYFTLIVFKSTKRRSLDNKQKYMTNSYNNNIVVVLYAQNNEQTVVPLLEQLNKQDYPTANYQVHIVLDNCTDNSANMLEFVGGAKIWRLSEGAPIGKDEAISWLLERLISFKNVNAFVFLNANRTIDRTFLSTINTSLFTNDVVIGATDLIAEKEDLRFKILDAITKYRNYVIKVGRSVMGLATRVDSDVVAIRQEVLEKIKCVDFKDTESELKYTVLLAKNNFIPTFNPNIKTRVKLGDFVFKKPSLSFKFSLFRHCFALIFSSTPKFSEFIFSMFTPNAVVLVGLYLTFAVFTNSYYFFYEFPFVLAVGGLLLASFLWSLAVVRIYDVNPLHIIYYPFYALYLRFFKNSIPARLIRKCSGDKPSSNIDQATIDVEVTDGKNTLPCKLDLISEDGLVKVIFRFKKKRYVTDSHIRMCDAIKDIAKKLNDHGFRIKICQTCAFFSAKIDGTTNMLKGYCNRQPEDSQLMDPKEMLLWNTCFYYLPEDLNKIVDINNYKRKSE